MKPFITFLALVVLAGFSLLFQSDMNRYAEARYRLKDVVSECAGTLSLSASEDESTLSSAATAIYLDQVLSPEALGISGVRDVVWRIAAPESGGHILIVTLIAKDFFRLPGFQAERLTVSYPLPVSG